MVPKLLVSVRDVKEAVAALRGGCDVLDVKEPARGPLGMADPATIAAIAECAAAWNREYGTTIPVSVALGEVRDWADREPPSLPAVAFVKLGTAGLVPGNWTTRWRRAMVVATARMAGEPGQIVVAYADFGRAAGPDPQEAVLFASKIAAAGVLVDTYSKSDASLASELPVARLRPLRDSARRCGLAFAIAGSLHPDQLQELVQVEPDLIGVRGAVCVDGRASSVCAERVAEFRSRLVTAFGERNNTS